MKPRPPHRGTRIFAMPALVAAVTLAGLVAGLLGDGPADVLAWMGLGFCLAVIGWSLARR